MLEQEKEQWITIKDWERYQISNNGNIRSLIGQQKMLKASKNKQGYSRIKLSGQPIGKGQYRTKDFFIHRLVAEYFCDGFTKKKEVHHKNLNKEDNRASNLICLTRAEHAELHRQIREQKRKEIENGNNQP